MIPATIDKKEAILSAALELISVQGFHGTPMSQVAKKANVSIGIIYHYFTGKEDLINALYLDIKSHLSDYSMQSYSSEAPVREAYGLLFKSVILYFVEHPSQLSFVEQCENSPLIAKTTLEKCLNLVHPIQDLYCRAQEQDLIKNLPFEMLGKLLNSAVITMAKLFLAGTIKIEDSMEAGLDAIWDMVKK